MYVKPRTTRRSCDLCHFEEVKSAEEEDVVRLQRLRTKHLNQLNPTPHPPPVPVTCRNGETIRTREEEWVECGSTDVGGAGGGGGAPSITTQMLPGGFRAGLGRRPQSSVLHGDGVCVCVCLLPTERSKVKSVFCFWAPRGETLARGREIIRDFKDELNPSLKEDLT